MIEAHSRVNGRTEVEDSVHRQFFQGVVTQESREKVSDGTGC